MKDKMKGLPSVWKLCAVLLLALVALPLAISQDVSAEESLTDYLVIRTVEKGTGENFTEASVYEIGLFNWFYHSDWFEQELDELGYGSHWADLDESEWSEEVKTVYNAGVDRWVADYTEWYRFYNSDMATNHSSYADDSRLRVASSMMPTSQNYLLTAIDEFLCFTIYFYNHLRGQDSMNIRLALDSNNLSFPIGKYRIRHTGFSFIGSSFTSTVNFNNLDPNVDKTPQYFEISSIGQMKDWKEIVFETEPRPSTSILTIKTVHLYDELRAALPVKSVYGLTTIQNDWHSFVENSGLPYFLDNFRNIGSQYCVPLETDNNNSEIKFDVSILPEGYYYIYFFTVSDGYIGIRDNSQSVYYDRHVRHALFSVDSSGKLSGFREIMFPVINRTDYIMKFENIDSKTKEYIGGSTFVLNGGSSSSNMSPLYEFNVENGRADIDFFDKHPSTDVWPPYYGYSFRYYNIQQIVAPLGYALNPPNSQFLRNFLVYDGYHFVVLPQGYQSNFNRTFPNRTFTFENEPLTVDIETVDSETGENIDARFVFAYSSSFEGLDYSNDIKIIETKNGKATLNFAGMDIGYYRLVNLGVITPLYADEPNWRTYHMTGNELLAYENGNWVDAHKEKIVFKYKPYDTVEITTVFNDGNPYFYQNPIQYGIEHVRTDTGERLFGQVLNHCIGGVMNDGTYVPELFAAPKEPGTYVITGIFFNDIDKIQGVIYHEFTILPKQLTYNTNGTVNDRKFINNDTSATIAITPTLNGIIGGDQVTVVPGEVNFASSVVGVHEVIATGFSITGEDAWKYSVPTEQPVFAKAEITKVQQDLLSISVPDDITYGGGPFQINVTGGSTNGEVVYSLVSGTGGIVTSDGRVTITGANPTGIVIQATMAGNDIYEPVSATETIIINKAPVVLTADDKSIYIEAAEPEYTYKISGIVNGDKESDVITEQPSLGVTGFNNISPTTFDIVLSGGEVSSNYVISNRVNGTLTVKPKEDVSNLIVFNNGSIVYTGNELTYENATGLSGGSWSYAYEIVDSGRLSNGKPIDAGTYYVTAKFEDAERIGTKTVMLTVNQQSVAGADVVIAGSYTYTGSLLTPVSSNVSVMLTGFVSPLVYNQDYTFAVTSGGTNAGEAIVTVTGIGNFIGTELGTFTVDSRNIIGADVTIGGNYVYTGSALTPDDNNVEVVLTGFVSPLVYNQDYTFEVTSGGTNVGGATVTVTGIGNFTGTELGTFTVHQRNITGADVFIDGSYAYTGNLLTPASSNVSVMLIGFVSPLVYNQDYTYEVTSGGINAGEAIVTITGIGNFTGTELGMFVVDARNIAGADVTIGGNYVYTGSALTPDDNNFEVVLTGFASPLVYNQDYMFAVTSGGTNAGEAIVTVTGIGNFTGTATGTFNIDKAEQAVLIINIPTESLHYGMTTYAFSTTGGSGDGIVSYTVVSGDGQIAGDTLTFTGTGNIVIQATKAEELNYKSVTSEQIVITVNPAPIEEADIKVIAPVRGATPSAIITPDVHESFTVISATWDNTKSYFTGGTVYTVTITLEADKNYTFDYETIGIINGQPATSVEIIDSETECNTIILTYEFDATEPSTPPDEPRNLSAIAIDGQVSLSWGAPLNNGGEPVDYYEVSSDDGKTWTKASRSTSHTFVSLMNGTEYRFAVRAVNIIGKGLKVGIRATPIAPAPIAVAANQYTVDDYVTGLYQTVLERAPDKNGFESWTTALRTGHMKAIDVEKAFMFSYELRSKNLTHELFVEILYNALLGRKSDSTGKLSWVSALMSGALSRETVFEAFVDSQEYRHLRINAYVKGLYQSALDRTPDDNGFESWTNAMRVGELSETNVAHSFMFSKELKSKNLNSEQFVEKMYQTLLGRNSDSNGKAYWVKMLNTGMSQLELFDAFVNSQEYIKICNTYAFR